MIKTAFKDVLKFEPSYSKVNLNELFKNCTIIKIYKGKDNFCRCGCGGVYNYNKETFNKDVSIANRFFHKNLDQVEVSVKNIENYLNIPTSTKKNKAITIYFNGELNF